jgi:short-subunit dehydrogenase
MPVQPSRPLEPQKRAIVIGASSGLGAALVGALAQKGYAVAAVARRKELLEAVCAPFADAYPYVHDVTHFEEVPALFQQIVSDLDGLDLVIYTAGIQPAVAPDEYNFDKDRAMVEVNALGAMAWLNEAALRFHRAQRGHIVGISSVAGDRGRSAYPGYHASKAALSTFLESLRNRLAKRGVTVTTIKPGFMDTVLLENAPKTFWVASPDDAAQRIVEAVEKKEQTVYVIGRWRWVMLIIRHIPSFVFRRTSI